ncbi:MAG: DegT/DnrJ/EryC1/StrS family aminotransferase [Desulfarculaceae bacterium]|nr:DegT/DnrJ/EryC1/StrS family aminotransferase [Desulfarculaceae bacterium]
MAGRRLFLSPPHLGDEELKFVHEAFESNYVAPLGPQVEAFEREFAEKMGVSHALAVSSGTAAMHLALRVLGIGPGDIVLASTLTFIGSVSPVIYQGAELRFIDSDKITWNMDPCLLNEELAALANRGVLPKAIIPTDIYGQCADLDQINTAAKIYEIKVITDAAEALGATYKERSAGTGAYAGIYSFNGNKIITTSGGGMLVSEDKMLIDQACNLSQQARDSAPHYEHSQVGYNYRMSNILAAIGRGQLRVLEKRVQAKRRIFERYYHGLSDLHGLEFMPEAPYGQTNRWLTVILITPEAFGVNREAIRRTLDYWNIESRPVWKPMHLQPVFKEYRVRGGAVSEDLFDRGLCLPSGTQMSEDQQDQVIEIIRGMHKK